MNAVILDPKASYTGLDRIRMIVEEAHTRVKFYGEMVTLEWLESLVQELDDADTEESRERAAIEEEAFENGQRNCECEDKAAEMKSELTGKVRDLLDALTED